MLTLRTAFILRHGRFPLSVEELIAAELLGQIEGSRTGEVVIPVALIDPEATCANCKITLGEKA